MISSDILRGYNDLFILSCLLDGDSYGYEISKQITNLSGGMHTIKETTLYSAFNRLEKNGYIVSYYGEETFGRRRTYYHLTNAGLAYYMKKCTEWTETKTLVSHFIKERVCIGNHH